MIEKLNIHVKKGERAKSSDFNRTTEKVDELIENFDFSDRPSMVEASTATTPSIRLYTKGEVDALIQFERERIISILMSEMSYKQDEIYDLSQIRANAQLATTALQTEEDPIWSEEKKNYNTKKEITDLFNKFQSTISTSLATKVDKVAGKGLSTEDFTTSLKTKLESLFNYNDSALSQNIADLLSKYNALKVYAEQTQASLEALVSGNITDAIDTFNEIVAFLDGIKDTEDLKSIFGGIIEDINSINNELVFISNSIGNLQGDINDTNKNVSAVQQSVADNKGASDEKFNEIDNALEGIVRTQEEHRNLISSKQDTIEDLEDIRSGAASGATALQEHQDISDRPSMKEAEETITPQLSYYTKGEIDAIINELREEIKNK